MSRRRIVDPATLPDEPSALMPTVLATPPKVPAPKKRSRTWDARRSKVTVDLPERLIEDLAALRQQMIEEAQKRFGPEVKVSITVGAVYQRLLELGLETYRAGAERGNHQNPLTSVELRSSG